MAKKFISTLKKRNRRPRPAMVIQDHFKGSKKVSRQTGHGDPVSKVSLIVQIDPNDDPDYVDRMLNILMSHDCTLVVTADNDCGMKYLVGGAK